MGKFNPEYFLLVQRADPLSRQVLRELEKEDNEITKLREAEGRAPITSKAEFFSNSSAK